MTAKRGAKKVVRTKKPKREGMEWVKMRLLSLSSRIGMLDQQVGYFTALVNSRAPPEKDTCSINDLALGLSEVRGRLESLETGGVSYKIGLLQAEIDRLRKG
jgi:hypothetical protein